MIDELVNKIKITTTNKKYWIKIWIYLYTIMILPVAIIIWPLNNNIKFILVGIVTLMLSIAIGIIHACFLNTHEIIMLSIIEMKKQENLIKNQEVQIDNQEKLIQNLQERIENIRINLTINK